MEELMTRSVKLSDDLVNLTRHDAELLDRAMSTQDTPWMSIGTVIERSGIYDYSKIALLLERQDRQDAA